MRSLMDSAGSDRPQQRTVLIGRERHKIEIAALSETRLAGKGFKKKLVLVTLSSGVGARKIRH